MEETAWRWFALDPDSGDLRSGEGTAPIAEELRRRLVDRGLDPLLVLANERWTSDLAGGPDGIPERMRTAAELAQARAIGEERELVSTTDRTWDLDDASAGRRRRRTRRTATRAGERRGSAPAPRDGDPAWSPSRLRVRARAWTQDIVAVAIVVTASEQALPGTQRLFRADDEGLLEAAAWRGQLEFACESWAADPLDDRSADSAREAGDAVTLARLLDDGDRPALP